MIPVLYDENEMQFQTMGLCLLSDCASVKVKRVLNGKDELEIKYPVGGAYYKELRPMRQILVVPEHMKSPQPYRIYNVTKPMQGYIVVNARHVSERRTFDFVKPFTVYSYIDTVIQGLRDNLVSDNNPWTIRTDAVGGERRKIVVEEAASLGSVIAYILERFDYECEFDKYELNILTQRGRAPLYDGSDMQVSYGRNLTKLEAIQAIDENIVTSIVPYWTGEDQETLYLPDYIVDSVYVDAYPFRRVRVVDCTEYFEERPTVAELEKCAVDYIKRYKIGIPKVSFKISFATLAQTQEYAHLAAFERVNLGDSIHVWHEDLDVDTYARIVETDFDVINEKYNSVTVGDVRQNMEQVIKEAMAQEEKDIKNTKTDMQRAIQHATEMITGVDGGYVVMVQDADGHPSEILIMDTPDKETAQNVLRINRNGIGFSYNGVNGPFHTAWTIDGHFNAEFITTGYMSANRIKTGRIVDESGDNYWDLGSGEMSITVHTDDVDFRALSLYYDGILGVMKTDVKPGSLKVYDNNTSVSVDKDGIRFMDGGYVTGFIPARGIKFIDLDISDTPYDLRTSRERLCAELNAINSEISVSTLVMVRLLVRYDMPAASSSYLVYELWGVYKGSEEPNTIHFPGSGSGDGYTTYFNTGQGKRFLDAGGTSDFNLMIYYDSYSGWSLNNTTNVPDDPQP